MQHLPNYTTDRDEVIVKVLQTLRRTLYNYAVAFRLDVDDLVQECAIILLEVWPRVPQNANTGAYLFAVARNSLSRFIPKDETLSLDMPISETGLTLADTIASPNSPQIDYDYIDYVIRVVHLALKQLPPEVQIYATETFEITGYQHPRCTKQMSAYVQSVYKRRRKADMKKELIKSFQSNPAILDLFTKKKRRYSRVR